MPLLSLFTIISASLVLVSGLSEFGCPASEFECTATEICIPMRWKCDGEKDCSNGKDESDCGPMEITCKPGSYKCRDGRCIDESWVCDGHADCPTKDDEAPIQKCNKTTCRPSDFQCRNGDCIRGSFKCDYEDDCNDNSDEEECPALVCNLNQFKCANNRTCIPSELKCDGKKDCEDESDENDCPAPSCDKDTLFTCNDNECIPKGWRCDGVAECQDHSDEEGCPSPPTPLNCPDHKFRCGDGECVPLSWKCDQYPDCTDSSDEDGCPKPIACSPTEFKCGQSGKCIVKSSKCDGITDCSDGSDETGCGSVTSICKEGLYRCGTTSLCIDMDKVCNGIKDCPRGEDESISCGINECRDHNGHCYHTCIDLDIGYKCSCHQGYKLANDSKACEDVDECQETYGICSQSCINTKGSYKCLCVDGYVDDVPLKTCKAKAPLPYFIFGNQHSIRTLSMSVTQYDVISSNRKGPMAVDYDLESGYVYWTDILDEKIERTRLLGNSSVETVVHNVKHSNGLAVDWIGKKLYWTDEYFNTIEISELNGDNRLVLFTVSVDDPRGIALDPFERYIFWTDWGSIHPKIERASMDGDTVSRRVIIDTGIMWPIALTLDTILQRVYFADTKMQTIETCKYDGSSRIKLMASGVLHPLGLSIFEDNLYYTDYSLDAIFRVNKRTGHSYGELKENLERPVGINVVHPVSQKKVETKCSENNGGCSHLCLLSTNVLKYSCRCPLGMVLRGDGKSCIKIGKPNDTSSTIDGVKTTKSSVKTGCHDNNGGCSHTCVASGQGDNYDCRCPAGMTLNIDQKTCIEIVTTTKIPKKENGTGIPQAIQKSLSSSHNKGPMIAGVTVAVLFGIFVIVALLLYWRKRKTTTGRGILFYKDTSRTPLQNDFDEDPSKTQEEIGSRSRVQFA